MGESICCSASMASPAQKLRHIKLIISNLLKAVQLKLDKKIVMVSVLWSMANKWQM